MGRIRDLLITVACAVSLALLAAPLELIEGPERSMLTSDELERMISGADALFDHS